VQLATCLIVTVTVTVVGFAVVPAGATIFCRETTFPVAPVMSTGFNEIVAPAALRLATSPVRVTSFGETSTAATA